MSNPYVQKEVKKVLSESEVPLSWAMASAWILAHFKGVNIKIYDTKNSSSLCDYNIIASAENPTQAKTMVDELSFNLKQQGEANVISIEGLKDCEWILLDAGDVIVHIFQDISRDIFDLDSLWTEAPQIEIPQEYYFGAAEEVAKKADPTENYF